MTFDDSFVRTRIGGISTIAIPQAETRANSIQSESIVEIGTRLREEPLRRRSREETISASFKSDRNSGTLHHMNLCIIELGKMRGRQDAQIKGNSHLHTTAICKCRRHYAFTHSSRVIKFTYRNSIKWQSIFH